MTSMTMNDNEQRQLGTLLVNAGIISVDMLEIALQISAGFGESLGTVLVDTNKLTEGDLQNALLAQSMISKGLVEDGVAAQALHLSHRTRLAFFDAVNRVGSIFQAAPALGPA